MTLIKDNRIAVFGDHAAGTYTFEPHGGGPAVDGARGSLYSELPRLDKKVAVIVVPATFCSMSPGSPGTRK